MVSSHKRPFHTVGHRDPEQNYMAAIPGRVAIACLAGKPEAGCRWANQGLAAYTCKAAAGGQAAGLPQMKEV
eukprot:1136242-Pelagomonas_calceolata.AAC.2